MAAPRVLAALWLATAAAAASDPVRDELDCKMRALAVEYAAYIQPARPQSVFDAVAAALDGSREKAAGCNVTAPRGLGAPGASRFGPLSAAPRVGAAAWFVDAVAGSDANAGTQAAPFKTVAAALAASRASPGAANQIVLRAGTHFLAATAVLGPQDSGLTVQAFPGEEAWVSGGVALPPLTWAPDNVSNSSGVATWQTFPGQNAVFASPPGTVLFGKTPDAPSCEAACKASFAADGACTIWTWHDKTVEPEYQLDCYFLEAPGTWKPVAEAGHTSGRRAGPPSSNVWVASLAGAGVAGVPGLRLDGARLTRARYPNGFPETLGFMPPAVFRAAWTPQTAPRKPAVQIDLPASALLRNTSVSAFQTYTAGIGGTCDRFQPNAGYWCSNAVSGGGSVIYFVPTAMQATAATLPNLPYKNATGAVVQTWRPGHWASWMYTVADMSWDGTTANFTFSAGAFQGSRGADAGEDTYIENVFEELDAPDEFFFDETTQSLYVYFNATAGTAPPSTGFVVPQLKALFNITGTSPASPTRGVTIAGLGLRDTAYTYMDPHAIPSGGDWTLERSAVVFIENATGINVTNNVFERVDGNALMLSGFVRDSSIEGNEFVWIGGSAVAAWGDTEVRGLQSQACSARSARPLTPAPHRPRRATGIAPDRRSARSTRRCRPATAPTARRATSRAATASRVISATSWACGRSRARATRSSRPRRTSLRTTSCSTGRART